jgi:AraC family transcriptional activator FtrA
MGTGTTLRRHFNRTVGVPPDTYRRTFRSSHAEGGTHRATISRRQAATFQA